jgi:hypothetical protein
MNRRKYIASVAGIVMASGIAGCLQGDAVLHKKRISPTSSTKEWEVELEEGNQMRLEVEKTNDRSGRIYGYVHRADTDEEIAKTNSGDPNEKFEVPATGTYTVSAEPQGGPVEGELILRDLN